MDTLLATYGLVEGVNQCLVSRGWVLLSAARVGCRSNSTVDWREPTLSAESRTQPYLQDTGLHLQQDHSRQAGYPYYLEPGTIRVQPSVPIFQLLRQ